MSIPVIDVDDIPWRYRSEISTEERRKYQHIDLALDLEAVVREKDSLFSVLVVQMGSVIEEKFNIQDVDEANSLARKWMEENSEDAL